MNPQVYSIVVTFNGKKWYDRCFSSLLAAGTHVICIDNASTDGSVEYISEHFPSVDLMASKENLGFAKANNVGIRKALDAGADFFFLLNQDAWVEENTVSELIDAFAENAHAGIIAPIQKNGAGTALDSRFVSFLFPQFHSDVYFGNMQHYYKEEFINAAAWMMSRECVMKVGGFDTLLFYHYAEDNNYCQRVIYHGFSILLDTQCCFYHDREDRKEGSASDILFQKDLEERQLKSWYGNVNLDIDVDAIVAQKRKELHRPFAFMYKRRYARQKKELALFENIQKSRVINKSIGSNWL